MNAGILAQSAQPIAMPYGLLGGPQRVPTPYPLGSAQIPLLNSLAIWLDASDRSTITLNGGTVSEWRSKGGRPLTATQPTASLQPTFTESAINGMPAVTMPALRQLTIAAFPFTNTVTAFTVCSISTISGPGTVGGIWQRGTTNTRHSFFVENNISQLFARRSFNLNSAATLPSRSAYFIARCDLSDTLTRLAINGVTAASNTTSFSADATPQILTLLRQTVNDAGIVGGMAEFLYYERNLSDSECVEVERYLSRKYGIAVR